MPQCIIIIIIVIYNEVLNRLVSITNLMHNSLYSMPVERRLQFALNRHSLQRIVHWVGNWNKSVLWWAVRKTSNCEVSNVLCIVWQYVAVYCSMLQYVAACCSTLQHVAACCSMLHMSTKCTVQSVSKPHLRFACRISQARIQTHTQNV